MKSFSHILLAIALIVIVSCSKEKTTEPETEPEIGNPYNLQIEKIADNAVELTWDDPDHVNNTYVISKKSGEAMWDNQFKELDAGAFSYIDTIYTQAFFVYSYYLSEINDSLIAGTSDTVAFFSDNSLPTEISLEHITQDSVKLNWHDNAFGEFFYGIDKKISGGNWEENYILYEPDPANGHNSNMSYTDYNNSLSDSIHYRFYLINGKSKSDQRISSIYSYLLPPSNVKATLEGEGIRITWLDNYQTESGFSIERKKYGCDFEEIHETVPNTQSFLDDDLDITEIYFYRIKVIVNELHSDYSDTVVGCVQHEGKWVPFDYETIQAAVDATNSISQIIILPGTYYENVLIQDKYPTILSLYSLLGDEDFIEQTVIDGSMQGSVIAFVFCYSNESSITGITLQNGSGTYTNFASGAYRYSGGGILCENSNVDITNTVICNNISDVGGGIAFINNSDCAISNCDIDSNTAVAGSGGGIYCYESEILIEDSNIHNNNCSNDGGGIYFMYSNSNVINSSFQNNFASSNGGGVYLTSGSNIILQNLVVNNNTSGFSGGGISSSNTDSVLKNIIISGNMSNKGGGIAFWSYQETIFENVLLINNVGYQGGGIYSLSADVNLLNVTAYGNSASIGGGVLYCDHYADPTIENSIFWNNNPQEIMIEEGGLPNSEGSVTIKYSDIQGGSNNISAISPSHVNWLYGNLTEDPLLTDNFHLLSNSPCIDAGNPEPEYNDTDGTRNDMGAYGGPNGNW